MNQTEVFKITLEDWYPSYEFKDGTMLVRVTFAKITDDRWRVSVWGDDDMGVEKDFDQENEAWNIFLQVIGWPVVTLSQLMEIGFVNS